MKPSPKPEASEPQDPSWNSSAIFVHHLRNSVGCLSGLLDMLKIKKDDKNFHEQFINLASQAVDTGVALIEEFSKLNQALDLKCENLELGAWLNNLVLNHLISRSPKIKVIKQIDPGPLTIFGDPVYLSRAVNAILDNAVEAMPEGGTLTIRAHGDAGRKFVSLSFQDTGIGMDEYTLEHAFVPFFSMKSNKSGLGLSWAQKIFVSHGGGLDISSATGKGASVSAKIPAKMVDKKVKKRGDGI